MSSFYQTVTVQQKISVWIMLLNQTHCTFFTYLNCFLSSTLIFLARSEHACQMLASNANQPFRRGKGLASFGDICSSKDLCYSSENMGKYFYFFMERRLLYSTLHQGMVVLFLPLWVISVQSVFLLSFLACTYEILLSADLLLSCFILLLEPQIIHSFCSLPFIAKRKRLIDEKCFNPEACVRLMGLVFHCRFSPRNFS